VVYNEGVGGSSFFVPNCDVFVTCCYTFLLAIDLLISSFKTGIKRASLYDDAGDFCFLLLYFSMGAIGVLRLKVNKWVLYCVETRLSCQFGIFKIWQYTLELKN